MNTLLTDPAMAALATTLLHSVWLFIVLTGMGWWVARAMDTANHRYLAYLLTLLSFPVAFCTVFYLEWHAQTVAWTGATFLGERIGSGAVLELTENLSTLGITAQPRWANYLALIYLIGLLLSCFLGIYRYARVVRMRRGGWLAPPELRERFVRLKGEIVPGKRVKWKITKKVTGALATGILHPVILFPVGLINALTVAEVEAILRHELIHLRRNDLLWNAIQELILRFFFYHPATYWLSHQLDREREYACDDAVSAISDRNQYARALVRAAKFPLHQVNPFTMAATKQRHFSKRIQRLFPSAVPPENGQKQRRSFYLTPLALLPCLLLFTFAPSSADHQAWSELIAKDSENQEWVIRGTVKDCATDELLIGATILIEGTKWVV
ncbi:MAG: M56 family metallopeptidase [Bacteroidota bacterium]